MKKIFIQFGERIKKHRKRLIYWILVMFIGQISFFCINWIWIENQVFAADEWWVKTQQTQDQSLEEKATERNDTLWFCKKLIYALLYPLLAIAWKLVDNSFVYWEIFGFDVVLWDLWNIVKNLANFTLWFFVVYKIFKYLIDWKEKVKDLLLKALIAWVWIQASRFLMAALIDVSTILAYWVWGFPISVLDETSSESGDNNLEQNPYVLKTVVYMDVQDPSTLSVYYTNVTTWWSYGDVYISECDTCKYGWWTGEVIVGPEMIYYVDGEDTTHQTRSDRCHIYGQTYMIWSPVVNFPTCESLDDCQKKQTEYNSELAKAKKEIQAWNQWNNLLIAWASTWIDAYNEDTWTQWPSIRLKDILNGKSYVWVFTALYSSLLNTVGVMPKDIWLYWAVLSTALSLWHMIAIAIPLLIVSIVFIMRIWILWMAIALAPFIVLFTAFDDIWKKIVGNMKFLEYFKLSNLIWIIFAPAIICFAVSLSAVLVITINDVAIINEIETLPDDVLWWLVSLNIAWVAIPIARLLIAVLWIAITWFLVWAAVESSKLWKSSLVHSLKTLATDAMWSIPIVPIPTTNGIVPIGWNTASKNGWIVSNLTGQIKNKWENEWQQTLNQFINGEEAEAEAVGKRDEAYKAGLKGLLINDIGNDWTKQWIPIGENKDKLMVFSDVSDTAKKGIIDEINGISDENKRAAFGKTSKVQLWSTTYYFVTKAKNKSSNSDVIINKYMTEDEMTNDGNYKDHSYNKQ